VLGADQTDEIDRARAFRGIDLDSEFLDDNDFVRAGLAPVDLENVFVDARASLPGTVSFIPFSR